MHASATDLPAPDAIIFDFAGVLAPVRPMAERHDGGIEQVLALLERAAPGTMSAEQVAADVRSGYAAYEGWKTGQSRRRHPGDMSPREFWGDFVTPDWDSQPRAAVLAHARPLCEHLDYGIFETDGQPGMLELLQRIRGLGIRTGCVSNSMSGASRRRLMREFGYAEHMQIEIYSDEIGMRKPHPEVFLSATAALGVSPSRAWYVGDRADRDVVGVRRAALGAVVLLTSTESVRALDVDAAPDVTVQHPAQIAELLEAVLGTGQASARSGG